MKLVMLAGAILASAPLVLVAAFVATDRAFDDDAAGGAVFDVKIDEPGLYPFVSHAFAHVDLGQVGLLEVGIPKGRTSH